MIGTARIIRGNALALPLADASVDLIVTSPPYFGLRSYQDEQLCLRCIRARQDGRDLRQVWPDYEAHRKAEHYKHHYAGQIGSEPTPAEFVDALIVATREMVRVLKPSGSIWVNLGDKYAGGGGQWDKDERDNPRRVSPSGTARTVGSGGKTYGLRPKSLIGVPWRYALRCIDDLGLILRAEVIWAKPNGLPESVTDRVRRSHETWFHLTKSPRYFSAVDEIREDYSLNWGPITRDRGRRNVNPDGSPDGGNTTTGTSLGKLPGSVWTIPTQPLQVPPELGVDHFAAFPMEFPRRIIRGWSPAGVCTGCGEGRRPVVVKSHDARRPSGVSAIGVEYTRAERANGHTVANVLTSATITGYACACLIGFTCCNFIENGDGSGYPCRGTTTLEPNGLEYRCGTCRGRCGSQVHPAHASERAPAPTTPSTILDPFGGTGTTALVAKALGRTGISIDMSADYCRLAAWRTSDPGQLAAALQVEKPEPVNPDQLDLFAEEWA